MKKIIYLLPVALLVITLAGCKSDSTLDDLELKVANNFFDTYVTLIFEDAATGNMIETTSADPLQVSITGADQSLVMTDAGKRKNQFTADGGLLPFNLDPYAKIPTLDQPVRLVVTASATGYKTVSKQIIITSTGIMRIPVTLISSANLPDGVTHQKTENFASIKGGKVNATATCEVPGTGAKLELREGTILKTAAGTPLEGPVSLEVTHYDTRAANPSDLFPGGISGEFRAADQSVQTGFLAPGGWIEIEIKDANGNVASQVESKSISLTLPVNPDLYLPEKQRTVQTGDKLKLMSFDEQAARWNYEGEATYGNGSATIELAHLSTWSVTAATQASNVNIHFTCAEYNEMQSLFNFNFSEATFNIDIKPVNGSGNLMNLFQKEGSGSPTVPIPAGDYTATFSFRGPNAQSIFKLPAPVNFTVTGTQPKDVEVVLSMIDQFTVLHGSLSYKRNGDTQESVGGNVNFRFRKAGNTDWRMVTSGQQGEMSVQMETGNYEVQVNDGGTWKPEAGPYTISIPADRLLSFQRTSNGSDLLDADFLKSSTASQINLYTLSLEEMLSKANQCYSSIVLILQEMNGLLTAARAERDLVRMNCINGKLTSAKGLEKITKQSLVQLGDAVSARDIPSANHEYNKCQVAYIKAKGMLVEAKGCAGEALRYSGNTNVNFDVDLFNIGPDPSSNDPNANGPNFDPTPDIPPLIINTSEGTATITFNRTSPGAPTGWARL